MRNHMTTSSVYPGSVALVSFQERAADLAEKLVGPLGQRWAHVRSVAGRAEELAGTVAEHERDLLVAAAWLHDIGYAPELVETGLHPLDGARYLQRHGWPERVVNLVAHHSGARFEAAERGMADQLAEFPLEDSAVMDALVTADLTTGPAGERLSYDERMDEILTRYPADHVVHQMWLKARPVMAEPVARTEERLAKTHPR